MEREKEERGQADELAGAVFEFFKYLYDDIDDRTSTTIIHHENIDIPIENAQPSVLTPDSITVTTVFGVQEEPSNVTIISGPSTVPALSPVPVPADLVLENHDPVQAQSSGHTSHDLAAQQDLLMDIHTDHFMSDTGDDADIDTDDVDAESAVIDEFIDEGVLTPTTTAAGA